MPVGLHPEVAPVFFSLLTGSWMFWFRGHPPARECVEHAHTCFRFVNGDRETANQEPRWSLKAEKSKKNKK